jgi:hypothetical protein
MIQTLWSLDQQFQNKNGSILTHGKIYVYYQGRTALANTYADEDGIALNTNPIILDNNGRAPCFVSTMYAYTVVVCDPYGNELFSYDITLHDVVDVAEKVLVLGTDGTVLVDTTTLPNGVQYDLSVNTDIIATNETVSGVSSVLNNKIDVVEGNVQSVCAALDGKKDKQASKSYSGSQTKTITNISQDTNGVITVTYDDIDLPPEVPNVEIVSPNDTISVSATTDTSTNTKTFSIDVKKAGMQFFDGYNGKTHYEDRNPNDPDTPIWCYVDQWSEYKYEGDFITNNWQLNNNINFVLKPGLYLITASIRYDMHNEWSDPSNPNPSKSNNDGYIRIATGAYNGLENGTRYKDWSHEYQLGENTIQMTFVRNVMNDSDYSYMNNNNYLYFDPYLPFGVNYVQLAHLQIVKLDSVVGNSGGGSGTEYIFNSPLEVYDSNKVRLNYSTDTFTVDSNGNLQFIPGHALGKVDGLMSVLVNPASGIDIVDNQLVVKVGEGLSIDPVSGVIAINTEVGDVVETVEKLKKDLDTQITTNFDMPNISQVYDFADPSVSTLANGACMLCQSFTIPINHELRTTTDDPNTPTLFGIYSQQNFGHKIMLALYEYTYAAEGEEHGSSTYVGDTGPVNVSQGVNEYPLKNRNPSITELRSDKVYYATLYLPNDARVNGLMLAGAPNYGNQSIPAEPRLSCAVENITWDGQELDMNDPTTTLNHYQEVIIPGKPIYYQYYIGPWQSGYNERWTAPRFYMQIRNGEYNVPVVPTDPFIDLGDSKLPMGTADQSNIPSFQPSQSNSAFRDVTPLLNVTITAFEWIDGMSTCAGWAAANCVYDSGFANNLSGVSNTVTDLGQVVSGEYPGYAHRITFTTPITLTAGTTYRFLCGCTNGSPYFKVWLDPTDVIHVGNNGWYVVDTNVLRIDHQMGMYNKLYDNNNNHYVI